MILLAGVAELYQGDLDLGRRAVERLAAEDLGADVLVEELSYGAVAVSQRLQELRPDALVLIGAHARGRPAGSVQRREVVLPALTPAQLQAAVGDAVTGYVTIDLLVEVAAALGALPERVVAVEVEPALVAPVDQLSPEAEAALEEALHHARRAVADLRAAARTG